MAKYKKNADYYIRKDYTIKLGKEASFLVPAGAKLEYSKQVNENYFFKFFNSPFLITVSDKVSDEYIASMTDEIGRSAGL